MISWQDNISKRLAAITPRREYRIRTQLDPKKFISATNTYLNWVSNDYLGLSSHPLVIQEYVRASIKYGAGSTGAPTLCGYSAEHEQLATKLAAFLGFEKCVLFNSGYQLAVGLFSQLSDANTTIWLDKHCHASHVDGVLLSKSKFVTFNAHNLDEIIADIQAQTTRRHIILTEATFSMDGTCSYLTKLINLKRDCLNNVLLIIDDAHGIGALGHNGLGTFEQLNLKLQDIDLLIGTLGKAFGVHGGFIAGSLLILDYLEQTVRSLLFSTYLPAAIAAAVNTSLGIITSDEGIKLRQKLKQNIDYFYEISKLHNLPVYQQETNLSPIQLLVFNDEKVVADLFDWLLQHQQLSGRILYPTVAKASPRIRISLNVNHSKVDIEQLCFYLDQ